MGLKDLVFDAGIDYLDELNKKAINEFINALEALSHNQPATAKKHFAEYKALRDKARDVVTELDTKYK